MLLEDGTLAYQAVRHAASSCSRRVATSEDPGQVRALPLIATSRVPLLSTYITQGRFLRAFLQSFTHSTNASSSASKITVDFAGYPRVLRSDMVSDMERAAIWLPASSQSTPPSPQGHWGSSGLKLASVNKSKGLSQAAVISLGRAATRLTTKACKQAIA